MVSGGINSCVYKYAYTTYKSETTASPINQIVVSIFLSLETGHAFVTCSGQRDRSKRDVSRGLKSTCACLSHPTPTPHCCWLLTQILCEVQGTNQKGTLQITHGVTGLFFTNPAWPGSISSKHQLTASIIHQKSEGNLSKATGPVLSQPSTCPHPKLGVYPGETGTALLNAA